VKFLNLVPFCDNFLKLKSLRIYMVSSVTVKCDSYAFKINIRKKKSNIFLKHIIL